VTKQGSPRHHSKLFRAIEEHTPGPKWASLFQIMWPEYKNWFLIQGDAARPGYGESLKQLKLHMPELVPTYRTLTDLAGGSDSAARFLSLYCPPPYLSGCTQAVWTGEQPVLVRNYDYNPSRLEGILLKTRWNDQTVIAMSDALWGVLDGINESGLAVSLAFGGRVDVGKGFGIPIILRYILEFCEDTPSAVKVLKRVPTHMSYNITVVDRLQRFATVFVTPDKPAVVRQVPVATNHQGKIEWPRHAWATATLEREAAVQSVFSKRDKSVEGLLNCFGKPPVFNAAYRRGFGTLYTSVYRPLECSVDIIWPETAWHQGMQDFIERDSLITFPVEASSSRHPANGRAPEIQEW
jgi:predicted choloylglycine hydrolase